MGGAEGYSGGSWDWMMGWEMGLRTRVVCYRRRFFYRKAYELIMGIPESYLLPGKRSNLYRTQVLLLSQLWYEMHVNFSYERS